jgi:hypothetical protein
MTKEIGQRMLMKKRLGDWNTTATSSERIWPFYFSLSRETLYRSYREEWHRKGEIQYSNHIKTKHNTYRYTPSDNTKTICMTMQYQQMSWIQNKDGCKCV